MVSLQQVEEEALAKVEFMRDTGETPPAMVVLGPPGVGKTHIWKTVAKKSGIARCDIRQTTTYLPEEIKGYGIPQPSKEYGGRMVTASTVPADFIPPDNVDEMILVLDDFNADTKAKQAVLYRLIHEHEINGHKLPKKTLIGMTGNGLTDKAVATTIASTIISRGQYFRDVKPSFSHWALWAVENGIHEGVIAFYRDSPNLLFEDPCEDRAWCCPRSIELMNRDLSWRLSKGGAWDHVMTPERIGSYIGLPTATKLAEYSRYEHVFKLVRRIVAGEVEPNDKTVTGLAEDDKYVLGIGVATKAGVMEGYDWLIKWARTKGSKEIAYFATRTLGKSRDPEGNQMRKFGDRLIEVFGDEFRIEMGIKG